MKTRKFYDDPFATIGEPDPGAVSAEEYATMARKPLSNEAARLPLNAGKPRLSDYAQNGKYTPLAQLEGRELSIEATEMIDTKYGEALQLSLTDEDGTVHQVCSSATNIVNAFQAFNEAVANGEQEYPVVAVFRKIALQGGNTCWTICDE